MNKTIILELPRWQGGNNIDYQLGSRILSCIIPINDTFEKVTIDVNTTNVNLCLVDGIKGGDELLRQSQNIDNILKRKKPDSIIVLGGDCSVSQVPFEYLKSVYKGKLGLIWLDAHPDVANVSNSEHLHEMVLANLLGENKNSELTNVKSSFKPSEVLMVGLIEEELREKDKLCLDLKLKSITTNTLLNNKEVVSDWIEKNGFEYMAIHLDLDVLDPRDFRSILPAKPHYNVEDFQAAVGTMTLETLSELFTEISKHSKVVGLSIAEHMPWDMLLLKRTLSKLSIFEE
ncbi:MAG: arginase family protein [Erysipelotrichaceae bacterium]|nr:arginase family protein [Erysipelotrichaceae bacterium]